MKSFRNVIAAACANAFIGVKALNSEQALNADKQWSTLFNRCKATNNFNDQYELKLELGQGTYGTVWQGCKKGEPDVNVAIKQLKKDQLNEHLVTQEIEILEKLRTHFHLQTHPNLVAYHGCWEDKDHVFLMMEYVDGSDLNKTSKALKPQLFPMSTVIDIVKKILHPLHALHESGVVHRDLKPPNILVSKSMDEIKLADFGFSALKPEKLEREEKTFCTPEYVAPEVSRGEYDEKCDIWAVGAITYWLIYGNHRFLGTNEELLKQIRTRGGDGGQLSQLRYPYLRNNNEQVQEVAAHFIDYLLSPMPSQRPSAAQALEHPFLTNGLLRCSGCTTLRMGTRGISPAGTTSQIPANRCSF